MISDAMPMIIIIAILGSGTGLAFSTMLPHLSYNPKVSEVT